MFNEISQFIVDELYTNDQIRYSLFLENLGGIRPSIGKDGKMRHLAIMTITENVHKRKIENPYHDRIEGDILCYTAAGRKGDQILVGKNKRLLEQYQQPIPFYGFSNEGKQVYRFLGLLEVIRHYQEPQIDQKNEIRNAWVFEFRIHREPNCIPISMASTIFSNLITERVKTIPLDDDREVIIENNVVENFNKDSFFDLEHMRSSFLSIDPYKFEYLVKDIIVKYGFISVSVTKASGDNGIDLYGTVPDSDLFFSGTFVQFQVKRWKHSVGSVEIVGFRGAIDVSAKGVFVTTSHFTKAAINEARHKMKPSITLIDGPKLALMVKNAGIDIGIYLS